MKLFIDTKNNGYHAFVDYAFLSASLFANSWIQSLHKLHNRRTSFYLQNAIERFYLPVSKFLGESKVCNLQMPFSVQK